MTDEPSRHEHGLSDLDHGCGLVAARTGRRVDRSAARSSHLSLLFQWMPEVARGPRSARRLVGDLGAVERKIGRVAHARVQEDPMGGASQDTGLSQRIDTKTLAPDVLLRFTIRLESANRKLSSNRCDHDVAFEHVQNLDGGTVLRLDHLGLLAWAHDVLLFD